MNYSNKNIKEIIAEKSKENPCDYCGCGTTYKYKVLLDDENCLTFKRWSGCMSYSSNTEECDWTSDEDEKEYPFDISKIRFKE